MAEQILKGYEGMLDSSCKDLPLDSQLGAFLKNLQKQLATNPTAGEILRQGSCVLIFVSPSIIMGNTNELTSHNHAGFAPGWPTGLPLPFCPVVHLLDHTHPENT